MRPPMPMPPYMMQPQPPFFTGPRPVISTVHQSPGPGQPAATLEMELLALRAENRDLRLQTACAETSCSRGDGRMGGGCGGVASSVPGQPRQLLQVGVDGSLFCTSSEGQPFLTIRHSTAALLISVCTFGMDSQISHKWPYVEIALSSRGAELEMFADFTQAAFHQAGPFAKATLTLHAPSELRSTDLQVLSEEHAIKIYLFADVHGRVVQASQLPRPA